MKNSVAFHLGLYVGEYIIKKYLPTLSVDYVKTNNNISVTCSEGDEYRRLENLWFVKCKDKVDKKETDIFFKNSRDYWHKLIEKYIPSELKCFIPNFNLELNETELLDFKEGISSSLWDSDCCHYDILVTNIIFDGEYVILKRQNTVE